MSHHPPVSNFLLEHVDKDYKIFGHFEEDFKRNGNDLEFRVIGKTTVEFQDGDSYSIKWPAKILENGVYMKYDEYIRIENLRSPLTAMVYLSEEVEDVTLPVTGDIYYRDEHVEFNQNAT